MITKETVNFVNKNCTFNNVTPKKNINELLFVDNDSVYANIYKSIGNELVRVMIKQDDPIVMYDKLTNKDGIDYWKNIFYDPIELKI